MKTGKKIACISAACLIAAGAAIGGLSFARMGSDIRQMEIAKPETTEQTADGTFRTLDIESQVSNVILTPAEGETCTVATCLPQRVTCAVTVKNGTLTVRETDARRWFDHLVFFGYEDSYIRIALPSAQYDALVVSSDVGDVQAPADFTFAAAQITTDTGDVDLAAAVKETLSVTTQTGDIMLKQTEPQNVSVQTDTGEITFANVHVSGDVAVKTNSGDTALSDVTCGKLSLNSDTGEVTLQNVTAGQDMQITTDTGDVTLQDCDASELALTSDTGDVIGSLRTEKIFLVKTNTGDIRVPDSVSGGKCTIRTVTGDVTMIVAAETSPE